MTPLALYSNTDHASNIVTHTAFNHIQFIDGDWSHLSVPTNDPCRCLTQSSESLKHIPSNPDLVQPDQLLASILAQSASDSDYLNCILYLLTSASGAEFYQRDPGLFGLSTGQSVGMRCTYRRITINGSQSHHYFLRFGE